MKRNLKIFLLIAVCAITGICMLCVREENKKQQIHSVKKEEKETLVFLTSKEKQDIFLRKLSRILMNHKMIYM